MILAAMDRARRWTIGQILHSPALRPLLLRRDARMLTRTTLGVLVAFAGTLVMPGLLFVLGPVLFGVVHVASDVRSLVQRVGVPRRVSALMYGGCAALLVLRALEMSAPDRLPFARLEVAIAGVWMAAAAASAGGARRWTAGILLALTA